MSNLFQNTTSGFPELKNFYIGPIVESFNNNVPLYRGATLGQEKWSGAQVIRPLKVRRNQGVGATSDGGTLPAIGRQGTVQAIVPAKYNYLRFGITAGMIKASQSDVGSFIRSAKYEMEEGTKDLERDVNRQLGWSGNGNLARLNANVVASNVIVAKGRTDSEDGNKYLDVGAVIDIYDSTLATQKASQVEITAVSVSGSLATLTLSAAVTASANDIIIHAGSANNEIQGLLYALDGATTTIYGVDRSLYPIYQGSVLSAASAQLTLDLMQQAENTGVSRSGVMPEAIWTDFASQRYYQKLLTADKRYVNTMKGDGGFSDKEKSYLEWNGKPMIVDVDSPTGMVWLSKKALIKYVLSEFEFASETGTMYIAQAEADALEARLRFYANLFNAQPAATPRLHTYVSP